MNQQKTYYEILNYYALCGLILNSITDGIEPITQEKLPDESIWNNPVIKKDLESLRHMHISWDHTEDYKNRKLAELMWMKAIYKFEVGNEKILKAMMEGYGTGMGGDESVDKSIWKDPSIKKDIEKWLSSYIKVWGYTGGHFDDFLTEQYWIDLGNNVENLVMDVMCGSDVNTTNKDGVTALMVAVNSASYPIVDAFIDLGADPMAVDKDGNGVETYTDDEKMKKIIIKRKKGLFKIFRKKEPTDSEKKISKVLEKIAKDKYKWFKYS